MNKTTTLSWNEHAAKIEDLDDRAYGDIGDKNLKDTSGINEEERQLLFDWNEYNNDWMEQNNQRFMKEAQEVSQKRNAELDEICKTNTMFSKIRAFMETAGSVELRARDIHDIDERFRWTHEMDFLTVAPHKYYYDDCDCPEHRVKV